MNKLIVCIFMLSFPVSIFAQKETCAILPFEGKGDVEITTANAITEFVQAAFMQSSVYKVVERNRIDNILKQQKIELAGATENAVEVGKLLSVNKIVMGSIIKLGKKYTIILKIINVTTGEIEKNEKKSAEVQIEEIDDMLIVPLVESLFSVKKQAGFTLWIRKCIGVTKMDAFSDSDVWVAIYLGNQLIGRTKFIKDDLNPVFDERFDISEYNGEIVNIYVYDHDVTKENLIGNVILDKIKSGKYPIIKTEGGNNYSQGQLEVEIQ